MAAKTYLYSEGSLIQQIQSRMPQGVSIVLPGSRASTMVPVTVDETQKAVLDEVMTSLGFEYVGEDDGQTSVEFGGMGLVNVSHVNNEKKSVPMSVIPREGTFAETSSSTYAVVGRFLFPGTDNWLAPQRATANAWMSKNGSTGSYRLIYGTTIIAEVAEVSSDDINNVITFEPLNNLPAQRTMVEVQARRTSGSPNAQPRISMLNLEP